MTNVTNIADHPLAKQGKPQDIQAPSRRPPLPRPKGYGTREVWNVISSGPSRVNLTGEDLLEGAVNVAVNTAIDLRPRFPIHVWAFWDGFDKMQHYFTDEQLRGFVEPPLTVWLGANRFNELHLAARGLIARPAWELAFPPEVGFRSMDTGLLMDPFTNHHRAAFSLIYVLEKCMAMGAARIRILCCDMSGPWHKDVLTEDASRALNRWDRWKYERAQVARMIELAKEKRDVEIELYTKTMERKAAA